MKFRKKKKRIAVGATPGIKFMAQIVKGETIDFKKMAEMMDKASTVNKGDILAVLDLMAATATWMLEEGHPVKFDGFGTFTPKAKVKAVDTIEEVTAQTVESVGVRYTPDVDVKAKMKSVSIHIEDTEESAN